MVLREEEENWTALSAATENSGGSYPANHWHKLAWRMKINQVVSTTSAQGECGQIWCPLIKKDMEVKCRLSLIHIHILIERRRKRGGIPRVKIFR